MAERCFKCKNEAVRLPVVVVPVLNHSIPAYLCLREGLCQAHAASFSLNDYTDYDGSWYDMVRADIEGVTKTLRQHRPEDMKIDRRGFAVWGEPTGPEFIVKNNYKVAPIEQCRLEMWDMRTLEAKSMRQKLFPDVVIR